MTKIILDLRGLALHSYFKGKDPDAWEEADSPGEEMRTVAHALSNFLDEYLLPICRDHSIFDIIAVLEGGNQFRKSLFHGYKEKRGKKYSEAKSANLRESTKAVEQLLAKLGILSVKVDGVEADDVIAYLVEKLPGDKIVQTVDKDLIQLASESVRVFIKNEEAVDIVDSAGNVVKPKHIALYKSLVGDSSDEYPGVPGVGPAGYKKIFGVVNENAVIGLLERNNLKPLESAPEFVSVIKHADLWKTCYQLAKLHPEEVERTFRVSGTGVDAVYRYRRPEWYKELPQPKELFGFLEGHDCEYLMGDLLREGLIPERVIVSLEDFDNIQGLLEVTKEEPYVSIDYETWAPPNENFTKAARGKDFVDVFGSEIVSTGLTTGRHAQHTFYFTFGHKEEPGGRKNLPIEVLDRLIKAVSEENTFVAQNCMPGDVEVLTPQGWVELKDVTLEQEVMQWSPETGELSFVKPLAKTEAKSDTLIKWVSLFHKCSYTPAHRMYVRHHYDKNWLEMSAETVMGIHPNSLYLPVAGKYQGNNDVGFSSGEARLMEAVRADGSWNRRMASFHLKKERKIVRLLSMLDTLGLSYAKSDTTDKVGAFIINVHSCGLLDKIKEFLGQNKCYGLRVFELSYEARKAILDEMQYWDGHDNVDSSSTRVSTIDVDTVAGLQLLAHLTDSRFSVSWTANNLRGWGVPNAKPLANVLVAPKHKTKLGHRPTVLKGDFDVYCLTVPSGAFMVRSKGHVHITGNCNFERSVLLNTRGIEVNSWHDPMLMASYVDENKPLPEYMQAVYDRVDDEDEDEEDVLNIADLTEIASGGSYRSKARSGWDLKFMARRYLGYKQTEYKEVCPNGYTMKDITAEEAFEYGADDPFVTIHLYWYLRTILEIEGTWEHVRDCEFPAACLISDAFVDGINLDEEEMKRQEEEDRKLLDELLAKMRKAIRENQTPEMVEAGVRNLYDELIEEVFAKSRFEKDNETVRMVHAGALLEKLQNTVPYADYTRREKQHKFDITPGKLAAICEAFGLSALKDLKPETVNNYWANCSEGLPAGLASSTKALKFVNLLRLCSAEGQFTPKRRGAIYQELRDHCYEAWKANLPDDKRYEYTGFEFNLGSPAQKKLLMYGMLNLPRTVFNPKVSDTRKKWGMQTGPVQTNKEAISDAMANSLSRDDWRWQVLEDLTTAQRCQTRLSLFYSVWPLYVHPLDGNVHPGIRSVGTETHRPSGNNPNALQLPKRGDGKKVRKCIVPNRKFYLRGEAAND